MKIALSVIALLGCIWLFFNANKPMNEIHILPEDFKGVVMIIYNQKDGASMTKENGNIVYKIPANGILKTQNPFVAGLLHIRYYYDTKPEEEIHYIFDFNKLSVDTISVFGASSGTYGAGGPNEIHTTTYLVGSKKDADSLFKALDKLNPFEVLKKQ